MYGKDYEYAHSRLSETIVRLKGVPVYVHNVRHGMKVQFSDLDAMDDIQECHIDEFDLHPVPLGYCNYNKLASYLSHVPMRRDWRQGLRRGNFVSLSGIDANRIPYESLRQAILGDYPTFNAAVEAASKVKSIAWHRHWAINVNGQVLYKGGVRPVGKIENGQVVLDSRYMYLTEALKESL